MRALPVLVLVGCGAVAATPAPQPTVENGTVVLDGPPLAVPGEAMEYRVELRGMTVGRVQVALGQAGWIGDRPAVIVKARGTTAGLVAMLGDITWELTTTLDLERPLPISAVEEFRAIVGDEDEHDRDEDTWSEGDDHHNLHSAVCAIRRWRSKPGQRTRFEVELVDLDLDVEMWEDGREYLASAKLPAVRYTGEVEDRYKFHAWISDDTARVPLGLRTESKLGEIAVELVDYDPPHEPR
jgi:hypothetical protein